MKFPKKLWQWQMLGKIVVVMTNTSSKKWGPDSGVWRLGPVFFRLQGVRNGGN
jgi:hypothetical protein